MEEADAGTTLMSFLEKSNSEKSGSLPAITKGLLEKVTLSCLARNLKRERIGERREWEGRE